MEVISASAKDYLTFRETSKKCDYLGVHTPYSYWVVCNFFGDSCFMLKDQENIIGTIMTVHNKDTLFVWQIGIIKEYRRKGYSQILYDAVLNFARQNGQTKIAMSVDPENEASFRAIERFCKRNNLLSKQVGSVDIILPEEDYDESELLLEIAID